MCITKETGSKRGQSFFTVYVSIPTHGKTLHTSASRGNQEKSGSRPKQIVLK